MVHRTGKNLSRNFMKHDIQVECNQIVICASYRCLAKFQNIKAVVPKEIEALEENVK